MPNWNIQRPDYDDGVCILPYGNVLSNGRDCKRKLSRRLFVFGCEDKDYMPRREILSCGVCVSEGLRAG